MLATTPLPDAVFKTVIDAADAVSVPRRDPANSFVLHAPLELMARVGLLPYLGAETQAEAIGRIGTLAEHYCASGPAADAPAHVSFDSPEAAATAVTAAIARSDLDAVDTAMCWLTEHAAPRELRLLLGEAVVDSLAAAGHTPIGLYLLPLVGDRRLPASLLRGPVRELARAPEWRLTWFRSDAPGVAAPRTAGLYDALRAVPQLGRPGSDFIFPLMSQAEQSGAARAAMEPYLDTDLATARSTLLRAAAWSMLHDDPGQAPYGWTHCLTMPQAVLALSGDGVEPRTALAVAGTYVVGFRAAHGLELLGLLADEANVAGNAPDPTALAAYASLHQDAHLVKYTHACFLAAEADPAWRTTYLTAAQHLADWWRAV